MIAIIADNRWIYLDNLTPDIEDVIDLHFSATDPKSRYIIDSQEQGWDGVYRKYNRRHQRLAKAFLNELIYLCKVKNIPLGIKDARDAPPFPMFSADDIQSDMLDGITLADYQIRGIKSCISNEVGLLHMITGAGKTELICAIAKLLKCPTTIIAEETVVIDQIKSRLELRKVVEEAGIFYAGKTPGDSLVCVGSVASFYAPPPISRKPKESKESYEKRKKGAVTRSKNAKKYRQLISKCELVMVDEADKATNKQYKKLLQKYTNCRYLYGFTGTLPDKQRDPVQYLHLKELLGNTIAHAGRRELENAGRIIPVKYVMFTMGRDNRNNAAAFDIAQKRWIDENVELHNHIKSLVESLSNDNFLILVESITVGKRLEEIVTGSKFIYGSTSHKIRNEILDNFANRNIRILIGSKILKRGLDVRGGIDNVILCASSKKYSELEQKIGRALRINNRGWARIFDYMYLQNKHLYKHSRERLSRMIQLGYPTTVATGKHRLGGEKVMKRGFNIAKYM